MKTFTRFFLIVAMSSGVLAPASGVTGNQLARYFGITSISTTVWLPPKSYVEAIHEIKDGKVGRLLIETEIDWVTSEKGHFTIMPGTENQKQKVVLFIGESMTVTAESDIPTMGGSVYPPLPEFIKEPGDHVFLGRGDLRGIKNLNDVKNYENGLVLRIVSAPLP